MCKFPKIVYIKPRDYRFKLPMISRCRKCYDCMMQDRAQFALRCAKEFTSTKGCCYFLTLTYSDKNLPFWNFSRVERRHALDEVAADPCKFGAYSKFILERRHASKFFHDMQYAIKKISDTLLFRIFLNGEYGFWTQRPHYHVLLFSPVFFTKSDMKTFIERNAWKFGGVHVKDVCSANINYVGKHCMKEDSGSILQKKVAPIFHTSSKYLGGIGVNLENDETLLANYANDANYTYNGRYKVQIPRYITKRLHPDTYSVDELKQMCRDAYSSLCQRIFSQCGVNFDLNYNHLGMLSVFDDSVTKSSFGIDPEFQFLSAKYKAAVDFFRSRNIDTVKQELTDYFYNKFQKHKQKLKKDGFINIS